MLPNTPRWIEPIATARRTGRPIALLFDYDGTLTPIVRHPSLAVLEHRTRNVLARLSRVPGVTVGVLSGRPLTEVKELIGLPLPCFAGSGGLESELGGEQFAYPAEPGYTGTLTALHESLLHVLRKFPGTWIERKPLAMAVHYRELLPPTAICFRRETEAVLAGFHAVRFRVVTQAIEIMPADGWHKGTAVENVLDRVRSTSSMNALAAYFGDAANDEEGMAVVAAAGGVTVGIGPEPPAAAAHHLPDPHALTHWLEHLPMAWGPRRAPINTKLQPRQPCVDPAHAT